MEKFHTQKIMQTRLYKRRRSMYGGHAMGALPGWPSLSHGRILQLSLYKRQARAKQEGIARIRKMNIRQDSCNFILRSKLQTTTAAIPERGGAASNTASSRGVKQVWNVPIRCLASTWRTSPRTTQRILSDRCSQHPRQDEGGLNLFCGGSSTTWIAPPSSWRSLALLSAAAAAAVALLRRLVRRWS